MESFPGVVVGMKTVVGLRRHIGAILAALDTWLLQEISLKLSGMCFRAVHRQPAGQGREQSVKAIHFRGLYSLRMTTILESVSTDFIK